MHYTDACMEDAAPVRLPWDLTKEIMRVYNRGSTIWFFSPSRAITCGMRVLLAMEREYFKFWGQFRAS